MNRLKIGRYPLDDTFVPTLLKLNVKNLLLTDTKLTGKGFTKLAQLKSLKTITITQSDLINSEDIKHFEKIRPDTEVILRDKHGQRVVDLTPVNRSTMFNIEKGDFSYSNRSIKGFNVKDEDFIAIAKSYPDALLLKLSNSSITGEGLKYLSHKNKLITIRIESDIFNEVGARQLLTFPDLKDVRIHSANKMSAETLTTITKIPKLSILELQHIAAMPPATCSIISEVKNLKSLSLFGSRPIDKDDLANLSKLTKLKKLSLRSTPVDDNCIPAILSIKCPKIDLNHTRITDSGLSQLENLKTLKELGLSVNKNLTVAAIKKVSRQKERLQGESL